MRSTPAPLPTEIRPARGDEVEAAVRLILASPGGFSAEAQVADFVRLVAAQRGPVGGMWIAQHGGRIASAVIPVVSPGRTMLLFPPGHIHSEFQGELTRQLIDQVCRTAVEHGVHLAQALLDTQAADAAGLLDRCSFRRLAELLYLQATIPRTHRKPSLQDGFHWLTYSAQNHALLARTVLATYQNSLDCPGLNGLRDIEDVLAGHRATGEFNPDLWFILCHEQEPLGVLLLNRVPHSDVIELVYLGLTAQCRGRGIGDLLMCQAAAMVAACGATRLSLAVDAENLPALKLYWRHGMQAFGRKAAMLRDLRKTTVSLGPAVEDREPAAENRAPTPDGATP